MNNNASCFSCGSGLSCKCLQERLGLSTAVDVEEWLVRAIGRKLIEGQMDQVKQQVTVTKAAQRTFGPENWGALEKQLAAWKVSPASAQVLEDHILHKVWVLPETTT